MTEREAVSFHQGKADGMMSSTEAARRVLILAAESLVNAQIPTREARGAPWLAEMRVSIAREERELSRRKRMDYNVGVMRGVWIGQSVGERLADLRAWLTLAESMS